MHSSNFAIRAGVIATLVSIVLLHATFMVAQESTIPLVDTSQVGSPITVGGTVTMSDTGSEVRYSFKANFFIKNVSRKNVLLSVIRLTVTGLNKVDIYNTREDDYFFARDTLAPNIPQAVHMSLGRFGEPTANVEAKPRIPKAVASTIFVEFDDGSTWGDPVAARDALVRRHSSWEKLQLLENTYQKQGEQSFVSELMKPSELPIITELQQLLAHRKDVQIVIDRINGMVDYATKHHRSLEGN